MQPRHSGDRLGEPAVSGHGGDIVSLPPFRLTPQPAREGCLGPVPYVSTPNRRRPGRVPQSVSVAGATAATATRACVAGLCVSRPRLTTDGHIVRSRDRGRAHCTRWRCLRCAARGRAGRRLVARCGSGSGPLEVGRRWCGVLGKRAGQWHRRYRECEDQPSDVLAHCPLSFIDPGRLSGGSP
jgi:hypothetical protein